MVPNSNIASHPSQGPPTVGEELMFVCANEVTDRINNKMTILDVFIALILVINCRNRSWNSTSSDKLFSILDKMQFQQ